MTTALEIRKLKIRDVLAEVEDEAIIYQIEQFLRKNVDFWDDLSDFDKSEIEEGLAELDNGEGIEHEELMFKLRKK